MQEPTESSGSWCLRQLDSEEHVMGTHGILGPWLQTIFREDSAGLGQAYSSTRGLRETEQGKIGGHVSEQRWEMG